MSDAKVNVLHVSVSVCLTSHLYRNFALLSLVGKTSPCPIIEVRSIADVLSPWLVQLRHALDPLSRCPSGSNPL